MILNRQSAVFSPHTSPAGDGDSDADEDPRDTARKKQERGAPKMRNEAFFDRNSGEANFFSLLFHAFDGGGGRQGGSRHGREGQELECGELGLPGLQTQSMNQKRLECSDSMHYIHAYNCISNASRAHRCM